MSTDLKIGLEIHCQLTALKSKLFCPCPTDYRGKEANSNICPICMGLPGTLPLLNRRAIEYAAMVSLSLNCSIPERIIFYRKNYFYPDLPKNFQITQYNAYGISSIGVDGSIEVNNRRIRIRRIQLEEDPGRLVYEGSMDRSLYTLVDYNRAGVALVEIVTEPDFKDPKDVRAFLNKLSSIIEHLGICDTNLEGAVRCDANISIAGGKRVEIKNVNSFKDVEKALIFEISRQKSLGMKGIEVEAETRHWDDARRVTVQSRGKEEEEDYRYFPEPDIPVIKMSELLNLKSRMPELPDARKMRFINVFNISEQVAQVLVDEKYLADFFEESLKRYNNAREIANWIITDMKGHMERLGSVKVKPEHIAELAELIDRDTINRTTAKQILNEIVRTGEMPSVVAKRMNATLISDKEALIDVIDKVFDDEKQAAIDALTNEKTVNFLLGKVMRSTDGRADPKLAIELIRRKLSTLKPNRS